MTTTTKTESKQQTSLAAINGNIALLRKNSKAFQNLLQKTLVMIATHAKNYGDCSAAARLMNDGLTNWFRRGPVCDYLKDFTPIIVTFKGGVAIARLEEKDQRKPFNIDGMVATPYWEHKSLARDNELPQEIDEVDTSVIQFVERLERKLVKGGISAAAVEHTKKLIAGLRGTVQAVRASERPTPTPSQEEAAAAAQAAA